MLDEEEISDLIDVILCADDIEPETYQWLSEIHKFYQEEQKQTTKIKKLKTFYKHLDLDYVTKDGNYFLYIKGTEDGLNVTIGKQDFFFSYEELVNRIDQLMLLGIYPFHEKDDPFDDYAIPDEREEAQQAKETIASQGAFSDSQLTLFEIFPQSLTSYEDNSHTDRDFFLEESKKEPQTISFPDSHQKKSDLALQTEQENREHDHIQKKASRYHFSEEHHLYDGGAKTKCQNNITAIRLLKELQSQGRMATAEEQKILAKFVGWGGLAHALTPGKSGWETQYEEIKCLLTEKEFQAAQESTLTAYYTEQSVIRHIYHALEQFGFKGGNLLDPAMALSLIHI